MTLREKMNSTRRTARGRCLKNIIQSDINSKSTCLTLNIPHDIACHICQPKLCVLTTRRVNKKTKSERQKSKRNRCQQMWDSYWTNLSNVTTSQLMIHRKQRLYLGVEPDIVINNYSIYGDDNNNKMNGEGPPDLSDKQVPNISSNHDIDFQEDTNRIVPEKRKHISILNGNDDAPFFISIPSFLESMYS